MANTLNPFMNLFPGLFAPQRKPVAELDPMAFMQQMMQQPQKDQPQQQGVFTPELMRELMGNNEDVVGKHNAGSNLPSYAKGYTGPFRGEGGFKPMPEAFPELKPPTPAPVPANPWAGAQVSAQPQAVNPYLQMLQMLPQFQFGTNMMPRF